MLDQVLPCEDEDQLLKPLLEADGDELLSVLLLSHETIEVFEHLLDEPTLIPPFVIGTRWILRTVVLLCRELAAKGHANRDHVQRVATDVLIDDVANSLAVALILGLVVVLEVLRVDR